MIYDELIIGRCLTCSEEPHLKESLSIRHAHSLLREFCLAIHRKCLPLSQRQIILAARSALEHSEIIRSETQSLTNKSGIRKVSSLVLELRGVPKYLEFKVF